MYKRWMSVAAVLAGMVSAFLVLGCEDSDLPAATDTTDVDGSADDVYASGRNTINVNGEFDFDNGHGGTSAVPAVAVADMWWEYVTDPSSLLAPQNGAQFAVMAGVTNFTGVTLEQVSVQTVSGAAIPGGQLPAGTIVAYTTDAGRHGKLRVDSYSSEHDMTVTWQTWVE